MRRSILYPACIVALSAIVGGLAGLYVYRERTQAVAERFHAAAAVQGRVLASGLEKHLGQVSAMAFYFSASQSVSKAEFDEFSGGVLSGTMRSESLTWTAVVPAEGLDAYVSRIRKANPDTYADFSLSTGEGTIQDALAPGLGALVVTYVQPNTRQGLVGKVIPRDSLIADDMIAAIRAGVPTVSSIHTGTLGGVGADDRPSIVLTEPVFSGSGRARVLKGLITAVVPVRDFLVFEGNADASSAFSNVIVDRNFDGTVVYDLSGDRILKTEGDVRLAASGLEFHQTMSVLNRQWTLVTRPAPSAFGVPLWPSELVFCICLVLGALIAFFIHRMSAQLQELLTGQNFHREELAESDRCLESARAELRKAQDETVQLSAEHEAAMQQAWQATALLSVVKTLLPQGICILDSEARVLDWNDQLPKLLERPDGELRRGLPAAELMRGLRPQVQGANGEDHLEDWVGLLACGDDDAGVDGLRLELPSGARLKALLAPATSGFFVLTLTPENKRRRAPLQPKTSPDADELTGLVNGPRFEAVLREAVKSRRAGDSGFALLLLDLEELAVVNDAFGYEVGDRVLGLLGDILRRHIREGDTAARLQGGQFAILFSGIEDVRVVMGRAEQLLQEIWQPMQFKGNTIQVNANIGIAMYPNQAIDPTSLMRLAGDALASAKRNPRKNVILADTVPHNVGTRASTATKH